VATFLLVAAAGLAADLWTKHAVFQSLLSQPAVIARGRALAPLARSTPPDQLLHELNASRTLADGVKLTLSTNPGVVFGLPMARWAVALATLATIALVGCFFATSAAGAWGVHVALALVLAGALGNLYDRMFSVVPIPGTGAAVRGQVRDFIDCAALGYPWVFNVADVLLVVGVAVLLVHWWRGGRRAGGRDRAAAM